MACAKALLIAMAGAGLVLCAPGGTALREAEGDMRQEIAPQSDALAALGPLLGTWQGTGFLRNALAEAQVPIKTAWKIEKGFGGEFVRMEFRISRDGRPDSHWVGYFTSDPKEGKYHTTWTWVSAGRDFTFHETGTFDPATLQLTLVSVQPTPGGKAGETMEVTSVFSLLGPDQFSVEDTRPDAASGERFVSLRCDLTRTGK